MIDKKEEFLEIGLKLQLVIKTARGTKIFLNCNSAYKSCKLKYYIQRPIIAIVRAKVVYCTYATKDVYNCSMHTKVVSCKCA